MSWFGKKSDFGKVESGIRDKVKRGEKVHISLIDPDPKKLSLEETGKRAAKLEEWGSDAFFVGGSTNFTKQDVDSTVQAIKSASKLPVILYPGNPKGVSGHADAILWMSLLNSKDPVWISHAHAKSAVMVRKLGLEPIPMAYLIIAPGMKAGKVGKAKLIKTAEEAAGYCATAEMFGFRLVYLEAGSGATKPVPVELVTAARQELSIPLIVGGGLRTPEAVKERLQAGADIIVTGTAIEKEFDKLEPIVKEIKNFSQAN